MGGYEKVPGDFRRSWFAACVLVFVSCVLVAFVLTIVCPGERQEKRCVKAPCVVADTTVVTDTVVTGTDTVVVTDTVIVTDTVETDDDDQDDTDKGHGNDDEGEDDEDNPGKGR
jgi:hypothetical protein